MNTMKLINALEEVGLEPRSYSGRGMYGKKCVGVVVSNDACLFKLGAEVVLVLQDDEDACDDLLRLSICSDSLGYDKIVYFPSVKWPEDLDDTESNEY